MRPRPLNPARRALLVRSAELAGLAALITMAGRINPAAAKTAKGDVMYQDHRHDGKSCDQCKFFSPDGANSEIGSCSIVAGTVRREGWCAAFVPQLLA